MKFFQGAVTTAILCAAGSTFLQAQKLTVLVSMGQTSASGCYPMSSLVQGPDGNLYGTMSGGGASGWGTVFKMTPGGQTKPLYSFTNGSDGGEPAAALALGADGNFYGSTSEAGGPSDAGTIFKITPEGVLTTIYTVGQTAGPDLIDGALALGNDGNFYGTSREGGGYGDIFKITPSGVLTVLHTFDKTDGRYPYAALTLANDGNFYGTTEFGGADNDGTVFRITPSGAFTLLHSFDLTDGATPYAGLALSDDGYLYGTTQKGGGTQNEGGTYFKVSTSGQFTLLGAFAKAAGTDSLTTLVLGSQGNFYGATSAGETSGGGAIFSMNPSGTVTPLANLNVATTGALLYGLMEHTDGTFYGSAFTGGPSQFGTLLSLNVGQRPFVAFQFPYGSVGQTVQILGQGFTGATGVSFNGVPAAFNVVSATFLEATVPAGATSGRVTVNTHTGTLTSNRAFVVLAK